MWDLMTRVNLPPVMKGEVTPGLSEVLAFVNFKHSGWTFLSRIIDFYYNSFSPWSVNANPLLYSSFKFDTSLRSSMVSHAEYSPEKTVSSVVGGESCKY